MKIYILFVMGFASSICFTEAAITAWTNPVIAGNKDGSGAATPSIDEDTVPGTTGVTIVATDDGTDATYAIMSQPTTGKLTIDSSSGLLTLAAGYSFDFEKEPTYVLTITATSGASVGTATVTLSITDVNEAPVFESTQYTVTIPDGSTAGTILTTAVAMDQDAGDAITYTIPTGNTDNVFKIGVDGEITIDTGKTLDAETVGGYQLVVHAVDDGTPSETGSATVWVAVKTCSSNSDALIACMMTVLVALFAPLL